MELISILMPTYNVFPYIEEAVNSIIHQTYDKWELIIVDDCSTDGTYEKLLEIEKKDPRIFLYRNNENRKICKTLNKALSYAKGKYIARMDGDDISLPNRLEILKGYLDANPWCALVGSSSITIDKNGNLLSYKRTFNSWKYIKKYMMYGSCIQHIWLARREIYRRLEGYREVPYAEDYDFLLRGMRSGFKYANVEDFLYKVRIRSGNTLSTNGLYQQKAKKLVQEAYVIEKKENRDILTVSLYKDRIKCTKKELVQFEKANYHLNRALHNRNNFFIVIFESLQAAVQSKYVADLLFCALRFRVGKKMEDLFVK